MSNIIENDVTPDALREALASNREIEFTLMGHPYFAQPLTDRPVAPRYGILDVESRLWIFEGDMDTLFSFPFPDGDTLNDSFDSFEFLYIL